MTISHVTKTTPTDSEILSAVLDELFWTPEVVQDTIVVSARDGIVTLRGVVRSVTERLAARDAVFRVTGVVTFQDELTVEPVDPHTDQEIAEAVDHALRWAPAVPEGRIKAEVRDHRVVLEGTVEWNYQRTAARRAIENIEGVAFLDSRLRLERKPSAPDTTDNIRRALVRHALVDAGGIDVSVEGSEVTLTGTVRSYREREDAGRAAWNSPNVEAVRNRLAVQPS